MNTTARAVDDRQAGVVEVLIGDRFHPHGQRHLEAEIADMQKDIDRQKQEAVAANERLERTEK